MAAYTCCAMSRRLLQQLCSREWEEVQCCPVQQTTLLQVLPDSRPLHAQCLPQQQETCCGEAASLDMIAEGRPLLVLLVQQTRRELQAMSQRLLRGI